MTRKQNQSAALIAVTLGHLDKLDAGLIARTTGQTVEAVQRMIDARKVREMGRG